MSETRYSKHPKTGRLVFGFLGSRPVVRTSGYRLKTGRYIRFSGRPVQSTSCLRYSDVRFQNRFGTGFGTGFGTKTGLEPVYV